MRAIVVVVLSLLAAACSIPGGGPRVSECPFDGGPRGCVPRPLSQVDLAGTGATVVRDVEVSAEDAKLGRPLMVTVVAMASSEIRWNGVAIGRNGQPGANKAAERPGKFVATFTVPRDQVRAGSNELSARMSAHHLFLPVARPIHVLGVGPYETSVAPSLPDYLPALVTLGALVSALGWFGFAATGTRKDARAALLAAIAGCAALQLGTEVSRAFVAYSYPWQLARLAIVALACAIAATLIAAYAASRFAPGRRRAIATSCAAFSCAALLLVPWYDVKALGALTAGGVAILVAAAIGWRRGIVRAPAAIGAGAALLALIVWTGPNFLDRAWYLWIGTMLVLLLVEQVGVLRSVKAAHDEAERKIAEFAGRLAAAERSGESIVGIKDGGRIWRVPEREIVSIQAADDYCDVLLRDGRKLLATTGLSQLLATLPARFVRVHKSFAVNRAHVGAITRRAGGGRSLAMTDGSVVPVGRRYEGGVSGHLDRACDNAASGVEPMAPDLEVVPAKTKLSPP